MRTTLDDIRDDVRGLRSDLREDVNGLHVKLDELAKAHGETRERLSALESLNDVQPKRGRVKRYAPAAGILATVIAVSVEAGPAIVKALSTRDAVAQTNHGK